MREGQYLILFMVSLLLLWLTQNTVKREAKQLALVMLLLLLCPVTAAVMQGYQTAYYTADNLWALLPMTAILAAGCVVGITKAESAVLNRQGRWVAVSLQRKKALEAALIAMLGALLFLCGKTPAGTSPEAARSVQADAAREALSLIDFTQESETIFLLAPDEITEWARSYSGRILLPYGRNFAEPDLNGYYYDTIPEEMTAFHEWINALLPIPENFENAVFQNEQFLEDCADRGYTYLIFNRWHAEENSMLGALDKQEWYYPAGETEKYLIYRLKY